MTKPPRTITYTMDITLQDWLPHPKGNRVHFLGTLEELTGALLPQKRTRQKRGSDAQK